MSLQNTLQAIHSKKLKPVYLVLGTEKYLQDQVRSAFLARFDVTKDDLNFAQFDLERDSIDTIIQEAQSTPFFGDQRLVFVDRPYFLTAEKKSNAPDHDLDDFLLYLKNPSDTSVLVLFADYEKLDERKKITKQLKKVAEVINVHPLKEGEVRRYLQQTMENDQISLERNAFDLFLRLTDLDLSKAMQELEKLKLYAGVDQKITKEVVQQLIPKTLEHNVFELTDNVLAGNVAAAMQLYDDLQLQGEETIKINAILMGQIRLLLQCGILGKMGYQQANIAETLHIHPYRVKLASQQVRKFQLKELAVIYDELVENDYLTKSGQGDKEFLFQLFVLKRGKNR